MSLKSIVEYIKTRSDDYECEELYRSLTAEYIAVIATGKRSEKYLSYAKERDVFLGERKKDLRSAKEIIIDTFKKHNLLMEGNL